MDYFTSHIGVIAGAAILIAAVAVAWWLLLDYNAKLKERRAAARRAAAEAKKAAEASEGSEGSEPEHDSDEA